MIELMAKKLCCFVSNNINEDETDTVKNQIYLYGIELCISSIINIILIVCVGAVLGCFVESLIFLICFISLRQFTGGYHADTYLKCNLFFVITFVFVISLTKFTIVRLSLPWIIIGIIITTAIVALLAPIKNHHKHIGKKLQMKSKFISVLLWIIFNLCGVIFYFVNFIYGLLLFNTLLAVMALMLIGKIKERGMKMNKNKIAKAIAATALAMAKKACGAASCYGMHQAKEPKEVQEYFAKKKM